MNEIDVDYEVINFVCCLIEKMYCLKVVQIWILKKSFDQLCGVKWLFTLVVSKNEQKIEIVQVNEFIFKSRIVVTIQYFLKIKYFFN